MICENCFYCRIVDPPLQFSCHHVPLFFCSSSEETSPRQRLPNPIVSLAKAPVDALHVDLKEIWREKSTTKAASEASIVFEKGQKSLIASFGIKEQGDVHLLPQGYVKV